MHQRQRVALQRRESEQAGRTNTSRSASDAGKVAAQTMLINDHPGIARVLALQNRLGNAAVQRLIGGDHIHGRECGCLACKPMITQSNTRRDAAKAQQTPPPDTQVNTQSTGDAPQTAHAEMSSGDATTAVQRWPWDDDNDNGDSGGGGNAAQPATPAQNQGGKSGGGDESWFSKLNPFSSDDGGNKASAGNGGNQGGESGGDESWFNKLNPFSGGGNSAKAGDGGNQGGEKGDDGGFFSNLGDWNPFGGGQAGGQGAGPGKDDGGGILGSLGDWNPFKNGENPFGGFNPFGNGMPDLPSLSEPPAWWPSDWWPFGDQSGDQPGNPDPDQNPMPVGGSLGNSSTIAAGKTLCMTSGEPLTGRSAYFPDDVPTVRVGLRPQFTTQSSTEEQDGITENPLAALDAPTKAAIGTSNSVKQNNGFAAATSQYGTTDGKYQLKNNSWQYDDSANVINYSATLDQQIVWGIDTARTIAINSAEDSIIQKHNYEGAIDSMNHFAGRTGAEGPGTALPAFWSPNLATRHELVHVKQLQDRMAAESGELAGKISAIVVDVPSWWIFGTQSQSSWSSGDKIKVENQIREQTIDDKKGLFNPWVSATSQKYAAMCEAPAYADGRGEFAKLADQIKARAKREKWE